MLSKDLIISIRIEGFGKKQADEFIAKTPLTKREVNGRYGWSYTLLYAAGVKVGIMNHNKTNDPLHIALDLNSLRAHDEHWQTTLETFGVL